MRRIKRWENWTGSTRGKTQFRSVVPRVSGGLAQLLVVNSSAWREAEVSPLCWELDSKSVLQSGGDAGARTRSLCHDRVRASRRLTDLSNRAPSDYIRVTTSDPRESTSLRCPPAQMRSSGASRTQRNWKTNEKRRRDGFHRLFIFELDGTKAFAVSFVTQRARFTRGQSIRRGQ